jgi:hypothetical protein
MVCLFRIIFLLLRIAQEIGMERRTGTAESLKPNLHDFNAIWA